MRSVSFFDKFTSGSRITTSRSDLLKLPSLCTSVVAPVAVVCVVRVVSVVAVVVVVALLAVVSVASVVSVVSVVVSFTRPVLTYSHIN